uniref:7TM_GPCR_Srx domain-containing protein n=1 Tax=Caenorhabditis tropicalis TaxID=1561998 RepID=A0A1I7U2D5_9PELO
MTGLSDDQRNKRRKKWQSMYIQSVIQDFIQLIDITNYNVTSRIFSTPLWTFLFGPLFFALVYTLDGLVMLCFHFNSFEKKPRGVQTSQMTISNIIVMN